MHLSDVLFLRTKGFINQIDPDLQACNECGKSVKMGSGLKLPFSGNMECYIIGYMKSDAISRANTFRSLLLGKDNGSGKIEYIGRVGSGFSERDLIELSEREGVFSEEFIMSLRKHLCVEGE